MGPEFRITFEEINYGVAVDEALTNLAMRVPVNDLRYFVIAVLIQRESGGNLAEILDTIGMLVRERLKLYDKIRVLSAEGTDEMGLKMIGAALINMVLGVLWMRKIIRIRV
jgi:tight adherence protein B